MPTAPSVRSIEFTQNQITGVVTSPFTGQQQLLDWQAGYAEASLELPPLTTAESTSWLAFIMACRGPMSVFQLPSLLAGLVPSGMAPAGYWRLKNGANKWSVTLPFIYGLHFEIREAL